MSKFLNKQEEHFMDQFCGSFCLKFWSVHLTEGYEEVIRENQIFFLPEDI